MSSKFGPHKDMFGPRLGCAPPLMPLPSDSNLAGLLPFIDAKTADLELAWSARLSTLEARIDAVETHLTSFITTLNTTHTSASLATDFPKPGRHVEASQSEILAAQAALRTDAGSGDPFDSAIESDLAAAQANFANQVSKQPSYRVSALRKASHLARRMLGVTEDLLDKSVTEVYRFGESTWDIALFIGSGPLGPLGSWQTIVLVIASILMQSIFVGICMMNFTKPHDQIAAPEKLKLWRATIGHGSSFFDGQSSLVARVCAGDVSLENSGVQMDLYENLVKYLKPDAIGIEKLLTGPTLCLVAIVCWLLMVCKDLQNALNLLRALSAIPRTTSTKLEPIELPGIPLHFKVVTLSHMRAGMGLVVFIYRVVSDLFLAYAGVVFLVYTLEITELILNAVALEVILNIDDLLFDALATTPGRHLVHRLQPLEMPKWPRFRGLDIKSCSMTLLMPIIVVCIYAFSLGPFVEQVDTAAYLLCGGQTDFVLSTHAPTGLVFSHNSEPYDEQLGASTLAVKIAYTLAFDSKIIEGGDLHVTSWHKMLSIESQSLQEYIDTYGKCEDASGNDTAMLAVLRELDPSLTSCADLNDQKHCGDPTNSFFRFACPVRCKCDVPQRWVYPLVGCPMQRCAGVARWKNNIERISFETHAKNIPLTVLNDMSVWSKYWESYVRTMENNPSQNELGVDPQTVQRAFLEDGCDGATRIINIVNQPSDSTINFFCGESRQYQQRRPIRIWCPETCQCSSDGEGFFCPLLLSRAQPSSCFRRQDLLVRNTVVLGSGPGCEHFQILTDAINGVYACFPTDHPLTNWTEQGRWSWAQTYRRVDGVAVLKIELFGGRTGPGRTVGEFGSRRALAQTKWVAGVEVNGTWHSIYYATTNKDVKDILEGPMELPVNGWLPVNSSNTAGVANCVQGEMTVSNKTGAFYSATENFDSCSSTCSARNLSCNDDLQIGHINHMEELDDFMEISRRTTTNFSLARDCAAWQMGPAIDSNVEDMSGARCKYSNDVTIREESFLLRCASPARVEGRRRFVLRACYCN